MRRSPFRRFNAEGGSAFLPRGGEDFAGFDSLGDDGLNILMLFNLLLDGRNVPGI